MKTSERLRDLGGELPARAKCSKCERYATFSVPIVLVEAIERECAAPQMLEALEGYERLQPLLTGVARYMATNPDQGWIDPDDMNLAEAFMRTARAAIAQARGEKT